jgi:Helicase associated domain
MVRVSFSSLYGASYFLVFPLIFFCSHFLLFPFCCARLSKPIDHHHHHHQPGHCHVPLNHTDPKLGLWVKEQRRHYALLRKGLPSHMTEERAMKLDDIGFCWDTNEATWLERLRELKVSDSFNIESYYSIGCLYYCYTHAIMFLFSSHPSIYPVQAYRDEFGHCLVPTYWDDNPKLSTLPSRALLC